MTQLRRDRGAISNYFDSILSGLGKRGSSFMDVDAVSHDKDTGRFLFQEFKEPNEPITAAQAMVLDDLEGLPRCEVWLVRRRPDGRIGWTRVGGVTFEEVISVQEYQQRFRRWWAGSSAKPAKPLNGTAIKASDIKW